MKTTLIVYTRNQDVDYRWILTPNEDVCPAETRKELRSIIRGVLDIETYDDPIVTPRWIMMIKGELVILGVAVMNSMLSDSVYTDFAGRPVRGFFGLVAKLQDFTNGIPLNLDLYRAIYEKEIIPFWNKPKDELVRNNVEFDIAEDFMVPLECDSSNVVLNFDKNRTAILGKVTPIQSIDRALSERKDVSIVSGLSNKRHAFAIDSKDYHFMNVIVEGISVREEHSNKVETSQNNVETSQKDEPLPPKKDVRLKLIITIAILLALIIMIGILLKTGMKTQMNQNTSTLGVDSLRSLKDTIKTVK
jgi:hypothetical protein